MSDVEIVASKIEDHEALTKLTIESKSYWNYSAAQIEAWIPDLTITPEYIEQNEVFKLILKNQLVGYYSYYLINSDEVLLDNMFVSPQFIGKGIGTILMDDFFERVKSQNVSKVVVYSDPHSESFYTKFDFEVIGQEPTSNKNRFLPILNKLLW